MFEAKVKLNTIVLHMEKIMHNLFLFLRLKKPLNKPKQKIK